MSIKNLNHFESPEMELDSLVSALVIKANNARLIVSDMSVEYFDAYNTDSPEDRAFIIGRFKEFETRCGIVLDYVSECVKIAEKLDKLREKLFPENYISLKDAKCVSKGCESQ